MKKTQYQGVFEREQADGRITLVIRYKLDGKAHTEALGVKGAKVGGEILSPKLASLIRSDRMAQIAREGEGVLQRAKEVPSLVKVWEDLQNQMHGAPGLQPYRKVWKRYLAPMAELRLDQITEAVVEKAVREWKTSPKHRTIYGKRPADATINLALTVLRRLFNLAIARDQYFGKVPVGSGPKSSGVRIKSTRALNNVRERVFSTEEVSQILDWAWENDRQLWLQIRLSLLTGMRQRELCGWDLGQHRHHGLRWMDVDFDRGQITLLRKGGIYQTIPVDDAVLETLRTVKNRNPQDRVAGVYQRKSWDRCREELKLNPAGTANTQVATWHSWRHTYATWYLEAGGNIRDLCELMNHSDISITARYLTANEANQRVANSSLAKRLKRAKLKVATG